LNGDFYNPTGSSVQSQNVVANTGIIDYFTVYASAQTCSKVPQDQRSNYDIYTVGYSNFGLFQ